MEKGEAVRGSIVVPAGEGCAYAMGRMRAVFKADVAEAAERYSVSEWRLEPLTLGPGVHFHDEDHVFYVVAGTLSLRLGDEWLDAPNGSYAVIPGGTPHDFQNRGAVPAGFIAFTSPGGFEAHMPDVASALSAEDLRL
jgi:mannose-6-phosphate isomerase-like protein (cupin superfamily)